MHALGKVHLDSLYTHHADAVIPCGARPGRHRCGRPPRQTLTSGQVGGLLANIMRIRRVLVEGLFGFFRHDIPLNADERITIMHGPNGFGKTIILRMLHSFLAGRFEIFARIPLDAFTITFEDGSDLRLECALDGKPLPKSKLQVTSSKQPGKPFLPFKGMHDKLLDSLPSLFKIPGGGLIERIDRDVWLHSTTEEILTSMEVIERYGDYLPSRIKRTRHSVPGWMREFLDDQVNVKLIETKRLDITHETPPSRHPRHTGRVPTVVNHSELLAVQIRNLLARYASRSQELDRTFPTRLLEQSAPLPEAGELQDQLARLEEKRARLARLGFLDPEESIALPVSQAMEQKRDVLAVYAADTEKKLAVFDDTAAKIELLTGIVNDLFLYKHLHIDRERGYVFTSHIGQEIQPSDLSSGEQHQLVLLYELLFQTKPGALVLIDEPEISLHVAWQERFLDDLMKIARLSDFDVLVATHSAEIIGEHWDLAISLRGPDAEPVESAEAAQ